MVKNLRLVEPENQVWHEPDLRDQFNAAIDLYELTQGAAAKEAGLGQAVVSQWLAGRYAGDNAAVEQKIESWLSHRAETTEGQVARPVEPGWVSTPTAERIVDTLTYAQTSADLVAVYGGAGLGKTMTTKDYAASHPSVWTLEVTPANANLGGCLRSLASRLKLSPSGQIDAVENAICERLTGTAGLLIADEAQFLHVRSLESLRRLHDLSGVGLALLGNELIYTQLHTRGRAAYFAQLSSRLGKRLRLTRPSQGDVDAICHAWGLKPVPDLAREIAAGHGALRSLSKALRLGAALSAQTGQPFGPQQLAEAWSELGGSQ